MSGNRPSSRENVVLDRTQIKAAASLSANRTDDLIEREVQKMLQEAEAVDRAEDKRYGLLVRGDELPEDLRRRNDRLARLKAAKARLEEARKSGIRRLKMARHAGASPHR